MERTTEGEAMMDTMDTDRGQVEDRAAERPTYEALMEYGRQRAEQWVAAGDPRGAQLLEDLRGVEEIVEELFANRAKRAASGT